MKPYGWLNSLYDLALDGVFTKEGKDILKRYVNGVVRYITESR